MNGKRGEISAAFPQSLRDDPFVDLQDSTGNGGRSRVETSIFKSQAFDVERMKEDLLSVGRLIEEIIAGR